MDCAQDKLDNCGYLKSPWDTCGVWGIVMASPEDTDKMH